MNGENTSERIVIDGRAVSFSREGDSAEHLAVRADGRVIGTLELVGSGEGFTARRPDGTALTRFSPWGGPITARFQTRELAARALLASRDEGA